MSERENENDSDKKASRQQPHRTSRCLTYQQRSKPSLSAKSSLKRRCSNSSSESDNNTSSSSSSESNSGKLLRRTRSKAAPIAAPGPFPRCGPSPMYHRRQWHRGRMINLHPQLSTQNLDGGEKEQRKGGRQQRDGHLRSRLPRGLFCHWISLT